MKLNALISLLALVGCSSGAARMSDGVLVPDGSPPIVDGGGSGSDLFFAPESCAHCGAGEVCSGQTCVPLPAHCPCPLGSYCDLSTNACKAGCLGNDHCPATSRCDTSVYLCSPICNDNTPCPDHLACTVLLPDGVKVCPQCRTVGPDMGSPYAACSCASGFANCNGDPTDGCETSLYTLTDCGTCGNPATTVCYKDADHDGYGVSSTAQTQCTCGADAISSTSSKGEDCDDTDSRVNPGQTMFFTTASKSGGFDFNCDGVVSPEYNFAVDGTCDYTCEDSFWVKSAPTCGVEGTAWNCNYPVTNGCAVGSTYPLVQSCR